jgi:hypothetical protein
VEGCTRRQKDISSVPAVQVYLYGKQCTIHKVSTFMSNVSEVPVLLPFNIWPYISLMRQADRMTGRQTQLHDERLRLK